MFQPVFVHLPHIACMPGGGGGGGGGGGEGGGNEWR